jgi:uncharacterized protein YfaS (alpha-2-macroglobulin family)
VEAKGNRICLRGLRHGGDYGLTVRAGLAGTEGGRLFGETKRRFTVPNRQERVLFAGNAYVLPKSARETLPVKTVNLDSVKMKLYRVHDRNLVNTVIGGLLDGDLYPGTETHLEETAGELAWQGEVSVENQPNVETTTLVPLNEALRDRGPGIYVLVARPAKEKENPSKRQATQWLVVSDLGLMTFEGADGACTRLSAPWRARRRSPMPNSPWWRATTRSSARCAAMPTASRNSRRA